MAYYRFIVTDIIQVVTSGGVRTKEPPRTGKSGGTGREGDS